MTLYEAKMLPLPLPENFSHVSPMERLDDEIQPLHWNDVRFNFKPQLIDRRCFFHTNYMNLYNFEHDYAHTTGFVDEDLDYELPDPASAMHFKKKRSAPLMFLGAFISVAALFIYPICGLKIPQKDNPFFWRMKKFADIDAIHEQMDSAYEEYGGIDIQAHPETNVAIGKRGFMQVGNGLRIELDNYSDLIC